MAAAHASPEKQAKVKAAVKKKFPDIQQEHHQKDANGNEIPHNEINEGGVHVVDGKKYLKLPRKIAKGVKRDTDERHELGKAKDAVTDALGITNTKRDGVRKHDGLKGQLQMQASHYEPEGEMIEGVTAKYKGKNYKLLPGKVREKMSGKGGFDGDYRDETGKVKDWVTDKLGLTNTKRDGVKEAVLDVTEEKKKGLDGKACWKGYRLAGTKKKGGKIVDNCVKEEDKAFNFVLDKLRKKHGKNAVLTKDSPKPKPPSEAEKAKVAAERKKRQDADNKAYTARARKAGYKNTQDYTNVVARYGSEDNYRKGKGLGT